MGLFKHRCLTKIISHKSPYNIKAYYAELKEQAGLKTEGDSFYEKNMIHRFN